jgi:TM2 domain-containing membrane protein YozV
VAPPATAAPPLSLAEVYAGVEARKSRTTFVLLGIFLGIFGAHNFYAGYHRKGAAQLCLTVFTCFYAAIVSEIWAILEVCIISKDADDQDFH